jgi:hypothetical protein
VTSEFSVFAAALFAVWMIDAMFGAYCTIVRLGIQKTVRVTDSTTVRLGSQVEGCLGVLREALEEELEERVDVLASNGGVVHGRAVVRVRVPDINGLVQEDDVGVGVPRMRVERGVLAVVGNAARTQFEEQPSLGRASGATVDPKNKRGILRLGARLEEPVEEVLAVRHIEVTTALLNSRVTDPRLLRIRHTKLVVGKGWLLDELVYRLGQHTT